MKHIPAGNFKTHCLKLMDQVKQKHESLVITKHGVPVAKLVPFDEQPIPLFGYMRHTIEIKGDITLPIEENWDAD